MDLSTLPVAGSSPPIIHRHAAPPRFEHQPSQEISQAGMGIASLILAIICLVNIGLLIAVVAAIHATYPGRTPQETPFHYLIGTWEFATALIAVAGIVFGIGGLRQPNRRHSFATAGLCLNIAIPMCIMFFLLLSMSIQPQSSSPQQEGDDAPVPAAGETQPAWRSPLAVTTQYATIGLAAMLAVSSWHHRAKRSQTPHTDPELIFCSVCSKRVPSQSKFCRRCGHAVAAPHSARSA